MVPIFEQGGNNGIGHSFDTFLNRFIEICEDHIQNNKAKAFAFIIYDFHNRATREVLKQHHGFTRLDRLSGKDLSVFYLNSDNKKTIKRFNEVFLHIFDIPDIRKQPFVLFFKISERDAKDIEVVELERANIIFAFDELYRVIEDYIKRLHSTKIEETQFDDRFLRLFKSAKKIAGEKLIEYLIEKGGDIVMSRWGK